jgi:hypothetical protein
VMIKGLGHGELKTLLLGMQKRQEVRGAVRI